MKNWLNKEIQLIGAPFDMGASVFGARLGPEAIRIDGIVKKLEVLGYKIEDIGNLDIKNGYVTKKENNLKNLEYVKDATDTLSEAVFETFENEKFPLIIGGDHSLVLGSVMGLLKKFENPGVIYFDAHADINTEDTSFSGNIHGMPIAFLMGKGTDKLKNPGERDYIKELGIKAYSMEDIDRCGIEKIMKEAIEHIKKNADQIHISFDVDCLDPKFAPGTGVKVPGGMTFREAKTALRMVSEIEKIASVEFVEVNPLLDDKNKTAETAVALIETLFGKTQL